MKAYPAYKDSGIDWIGEIPEHWEVLTVGRLCSLGRGRVISHEEIAQNMGEYPVYSSQTENDGVMGYINTYDFEGDYVTWTTDGANAGTVFFRTGKFNCTNVCGTMQPKNGKVFLPFLPYILNLGTRYSVRYDINPKMMNGVISRISICLPPSFEQQAIANYLDDKTSKIDTLIEKKQRLIALLKEQRTAIINQAVTKGINPNVKMKDSGIEWRGEIPEQWNVKKLKYVARLRSGDGITSNEIRDEGDYPVYGGNGLRGYTDSFSHEGDYVLIGRQGALCGNINYAHGKFWASEHAVVATLYDKHNFIWFGELLRAMNLNQHSQSAAQPGLAVENINNLYVPVPSIEEQNKIANHIRTQCDDNTIFKIENQLTLLKEYRTALISEVVTGKVDVRGHVRYEEQTEGLFMAAEKKAEYKTK